MDRRNKSIDLIWKEDKKILPFTPLKGALYIFGRVESEADKERYREKIYEFIQYLKRERSFEYVDVHVKVKDERILSKKFNESVEDTEKLKALKNKFASKKRNEILKKYEKDFKETSQKYKDELLKSITRDSIDKQIYYTSLLYLRLYSPKFIIGRKLEEKVNNYKKLSDVEFDFEGYKIN